MPLRPDLHRRLLLGTGLCAGCASLGSQEQHQPASMASAYSVTPQLITHSARWNAIAQTSPSCVMRPPLRMSPHRCLEQDEQADQQIVVGRDDGTPGLGHPGEPGGVHEDGVVVADEELGSVQQRSADEHHHANYDAGDQHRSPAPARQQTCDGGDSECHPEDLASKTILSMTNLTSGWEQQSRARVAATPGARHRSAHLRRALLSGDGPAPRRCAAPPAAALPAAIAWLSRRR